MKFIEDELKMRKKNFVVVVVKLRDFGRVNEEEEKKIFWKRIYSKINRIKRLRACCQNFKEERLKLSSESI